MPVHLCFLMFLNCFLDFPLHVLEQRFQMLLFACCLGKRGILSLPTMFLGEGRLLMKCDIRGDEGDERGYIGL